MLVLYYNNCMFRVIVCIIFIALSIPLRADSIFDWTSTNIQLLHGSGFELGSSDRSRIRLEHSNGWRYGGNYMYVDAIQRDDIGIEMYGQWYPSLSLNKLFDKDLSVGIVEKFSITAGISAGNLPKDDPFKAYFFGLGMNIDAPNDGFVSLEILTRKSDNLSKTGLQITPAWNIPFHVGKLKLEFSGYLDLVDGRGSGGKMYLFTKPQLLLDVGNLFNTPEKFFAGIEYSYWHNKFGIDSVDERSIQAMVKFYL